LEKPLRVSVIIIVIIAIVFQLQIRGWRQGWRIGRERERVIGPAAFNGRRTQKNNKI
jgi:hypothetical protein